MRFLIGFFILSLYFSKLLAKYPHFKSNQRKISFPNYQKMIQSIDFNYRVYPQVKIKFELENPPLSTQESKEQLENLELLTSYELTQPFSSNLTVENNQPQLIEVQQENNDKQNQQSVPSNASQFESKNATSKKKNAPNKQPIKQETLTNRQKNKTAIENSKDKHSDQTRTEEQQYEETKSNTGKVTLIQNKNNSTESEQVITQRNEDQYHKIQKQEIKKNDIKRLKETESKSSIGSTPEKPKESKPKTQKETKKNDQSKTSQARNDEITEKASSLEGQDSQNSKHIPKSPFDQEKTKEEADENQALKAQIQVDDELDNRLINPPSSDEIHPEIMKSNEVFVGEGQPTIKMIEQNRLHQEENMLSDFPSAELEQQQNFTEPTLEDSGEVQNLRLEQDQSLVEVQESQNDILKVESDNQNFDNKSNLNEQLRHLDQPQESNEQMHQELQKQESTLDQEEVAEQQEINQELTKQDQYQENEEIQDIEKVNLDNQEENQDFHEENQDFQEENQDFHEENQELDQGTQQFQIESNGSSFENSEEVQTQNLIQNEDQVISNEAIQEDNLQNEIPGQKIFEKTITLLQYFAQRGKTYYQQYKTLIEQLVADLRSQFIGKDIPGIYRTFISENNIAGISILLVMSLKVTQQTLRLLKKRSSQNKKSSLDIQQSKELLELIERYVDKRGASKSQQYDVQKGALFHTSIKELNSQITEHMGILQVQKKEVMEIF